MPYFYRIFCGLSLNKFFLHVGLALTLHKELTALNKTGTYFLGKAGKVNDALQING